MNTVFCRFDSETKNLFSSIVKELKTMNELNKLMMTTNNGTAKNNAEYTKQSLEQNQKLIQKLEEYEQFVININNNQNMILQNMSDLNERLTRLENQSDTPLLQGELRVPDDY